VAYDYNARVAELQNVYNDPEYAPLSQVDPTTPAAAVRTPILAKQAFTLDYDYTVAIMVVPGFNPATVRNDVAVALAVAAAAYGLGSTVYVSDLDKVVEGVQGVLRISGEPIKFAPTGQAGVRPFIETALNQYPRLLNINIF
jgi:hypothetical protein